MMTQIKDVIVWVENMKIDESLNNISFSVEKGEMLGITGLIKEQKKYIFRVLSCFDRPASGKYIFDYEDINMIEPDRMEAIRSEKIGCVFENPMLFDELNVMQNVTFWLDYIYPSKVCSKMGKSILNELGMEEKSQFSIDMLSNMERVITALARAAINNPVLLIIDDIFSWLKPEDEEQIMKLLSGFAENGTTIIILTNSPRALSGVNRTIKLQGV